MTTPPVLLAFGTNAWDDYWQTRQHVLSRLAARGFRVGYTTPAMSVWERRALRWTRARWQSQHRVLDGVRVFYPGRLPPRTHRWEAWDRAVMRRQARKFAQFVAGRPRARPDVAYVFHPWFLPYLDGIEPRHIVYHADDDHYALSNGAPGLREMEAALVQQADLVIATTAGVVRSLGEGCAGKIAIIGNGADVELYERGALQPAPDDLARIPRPVICYAGSLNSKVDFPLVARLARARPHMHWALVGPLLAEEQMDPAALKGLADCRSLANVHFLGRKDYRALPAYCARVDANAMVYRTGDNGWWHSIYPLKMHECLSTGRPLLSSDVPSVREFGNVIEICRTDTDWLAALDSLGNGTKLRPPTELQSVARGNSWDVRVDQIARELRRIGV